MHLVVTKAQTQSGSHPDRVVCNANRNTSICRPRTSRHHRRTGTTELYPSFFQNHGKALPSQIRLPGRGQDNRWNRLLVVQVSGVSFDDHAADDLVGVPVSCAVQLESCSEGG